ncbi:hypothetical protein [Klebsiella pneumoniae]|uniref:hypothetical protein n=1 Tax=Klebsiella pneumoniae TaxID=573 RepID=UPI000D731FA8|nr:hypothetical protein [Klebsiella pneumoniae]PXB55648.1 hypothetical protein DL506_28545 [Klebsiella pneumoniae]
MSKVIKVVGVDPSMSNFGLAIGTLDLDTDKLEIHGLELVETKAGGTKKTVRVNSDDLRRAKEIWRTARPIIEQAHMVFCELPVGSQSSRAQTSYGVCIGVLACVDKPLIQVTPNEIKHYVGNKLTTSKEEIIQWAVTKQPDAPWLRRKYAGKDVLVANNELLANAIASIYCRMQTDQFRQVRDVLKGIF